MLGGSPEHVTKHDLDTKDICSVLYDETTWRQLDVTTFIVASDAVKFVFKDLDNVGPFRVVLLG